MENMHSTECRALQVGVRDSTFQHNTARRRLFTYRRIGKKTVVEYYYARLVYEDLVVYRNQSDVNGDGVMTDTVSVF